MTGYAILQNNVGPYLAGTVVAVAKSTGSTTPTTPTDPGSGGGTTQPDPTITPDTLPNDPGPTGPVNAKLKWAPPTLVNPVTWNVTSSAVSHKKFAADQDVIINCPVPINWKNGVILEGGRNVICMGMEVDYDQAYYSATVDGATTQNRALYILGNKSSTSLQRPRTIHFEGLKIGGNYTFEGVNIDMMDDLYTTIQFQNYYAAQINWRTPPQGGTHDGGDVLQPWRGPWRLRVDRLSAPKCTYQAIFLQPVKYPNTANGLDKITPDLYQFRNIDLHGVSGTTQTPASPNSVAQLVNVTSPDVLGNRKTCYNVYVDPGNRSITQAVGGTWTGIQNGSPSTPFVDPTKVGIGYVSPGYES